MSISRISKVSNTRSSSLIIIFRAVCVLILRREKKSTGVAQISVVTGLNTPEKIYQGNRNVYPVKCSYTCVQKWATLFATGCESKELAAKSPTLNREHHGNIECLSVFALRWIFI